MEMRYISPGTTSNDIYIRQLQSYLRELSYEYREIPHLVTDGVFGPETENALSVFQELAGLEPTGIPDPVTWDVLKNQYFSLLKSKEMPNYFQAFPSADMVFQSGDYHPSIFSAQHAFLTLSRLFDNFIEPDFTGIIDNKTSKNIEKLRELSSLPGGTYLDKDLWNILTLMHNSLV